MNATSPRLNILSDNIADDIDTTELPITPIHGTNNSMMSITDIISNFRHKKESPSLPPSLTRLSQSKSFDSVYYYSSNANRHMPSNHINQRSSSICNMSSVISHHRSCTAIHNASASASISPHSLPSLPSNSDHMRSSSICSVSSTSSQHRRSLKSILSNIKTKMHSNKTHHNSVPTVNISKLKSKWRPKISIFYADSELLQNLIHFMTKQYNEENILFLKGVQGLKRNISDLLLRQSEINIIENEKVNVQITDVYNKYIKANANKQINLSSECFSKLMHIYQRFTSFDLNEKLDMFNIAINEIEYLMHTSILSSFYSSEIFQNIARERGIWDNQSFTVENIQKQSNFCSETEETNEKSNEFFDHSSNTYSNKYLISSKGYKQGCAEWKIKILKCNNKRQEFGVVSHFDTKIEMNECGIGETPLFGSRAMYGHKSHNHTNHSFYYASYNKDNTLRCNKDLSQLKIHSNGNWSEGDIIKIVLNCDKGHIKWYLNDKQVRKSVSIQANSNTTYYPIISYSGHDECDYEVV